MSRPLTFPVLTIKGRVISLIRDEQRLGLATKYAFKTGWFEGLQIIDRSGCDYRVRSAAFVEKTHLKSHPGWFAPRLIRVSLELSDGQQLTVDEMRRSALKAVNADRDFWDAGGELLTLLDTLRAAASIDDMWRALERAV